LKQLQLIQILHINARDALPAADERANARRVNRVLQGPDAAKAASVVRIPPLEVGKAGILGGWRFTAR
jgi:hypothetical protein